MIICSNEITSSFPCHMGGVLKLIMGPPPQRCYFPFGFPSDQPKRAPQHKTRPFPRSPTWNPQKALGFPEMEAPPENDEQADKNDETETKKLGKPALDTDRSISQARALVEALDHRAGELLSHHHLGIGSLHRPSEMRLNSNRGPFGGHHSGGG